MAKEGVYTYRFPRPMVTVDAVVFTVIDAAANVLLVKRKFEPFAGMWALPGGFVDENEGLDAAVQRELAEETGLTGVSLSQFYTFGDPGRDPRGHVVTAAYVGIVDELHRELRPDDDAEDAQWFPVDHHSALAFDHDKILGHALKVAYLHGESITEEDRANELREALSRYL